MNPADFFLPAETVTRSRPVNLALGDERLFAAERSRTYEDVWPVQIAKVCIRSDGVCLRPAGPLFFPTLVFPQDTLTLRHACKAALRLPSAAIRGIRGRERRDYLDGLLISDLYLGGFFHWFCEILPKITALVDAGVDLRERPVLVPECRDAEYVGESLAAYGLSPHVIRQAEYAAVERLTFVPRLTPSGNVRPAVMRRLAERMRAHADAVPGMRRIYVSRGKAAKRRLLNEAEILPLLDRHGFQVICMEELSLVDQVRLAASSQVIVGLHGAGLTHMLWMPPCSQVLEIRAAGDGTNNCYYGLASDLGHSYYYTVASKRSPFSTSQRSDFVVDVGRFERALIDLVQADVN